MGSGSDTQRQITQHTAACAPLTPEVERAMADTVPMMTFSRFKCKDVVMCAMDEALLSYSTQSLGQCVFECQHKSAPPSPCVGVNYRDKLGICEMFFDILTIFAGNITGCQYFQSDSIVGQLSQANIKPICSGVVIMKRRSRTSSWYLPWSSYKSGFTLADGGYWLGLEQVRQLTISASYRLRLEFLCDSESVWRSVECQTFSISDEYSQYTLWISECTGSEPNKVTYHNGKQFSASDRNNPNGGGNGDCAAQYQAGWWYYGCGQCCFTCSTPYIWETCNLAASRMTMILKQ